MQYLAIYLLVQPSVTMVTVETQTWTRPSRLTHPGMSTDEGVLPPVDISKYIQR